MSRANPRFRRPQTPLPAPTNNTYMVRIIGTCQVQEFIQTLYYTDQNTIAFGPSTTQLAGYFATTGVGALKASFATDIEMTGIAVTCLTSPTQPTVKDTFTPVVGTIAGLSAGSILAMTVLRYTGFRTKCGRGYVNLPFPLTYRTLASDNELNAAGITGGQNYAMNWFANMLTIGGINFTPALVSRGTRTAPKVLGVAPIVNTGVAAVIGTVRRRKLGKGQ